MRRRKNLRIWVVDDRRHVSAFVGRDAAPAGGESVGVFLRTGRERRGETVEQVATALRINSSYVSSIEADDFASLPGSTYLTGFVRAYAEYLNADVDAVLAHLRDEAPRSETRIGLKFPEPIPERRFPTGVAAALIVCLSLSGYAAWYYETSREQGLPPISLAEQESRAKDNLPPLENVRPPRSLVSVNEDTVGPTEAPVSTDSSGVHRVSAVQLERLPGDVEIASAIPPLGILELPPLKVRQGERVRRTAASDLSLPGHLVPVDADPSRAFAAAPVRPDRDETASEGGDISASRIVLHAVRANWIEIRDEAENVVLMARLLKEGESYSVPDRPGLTMTAGNAGELEVILDGTVLPRLGAVRQVVRGIPLTADALKSRTATR